MVWCQELSFAPYSGLRPLVGTNLIRFPFSLEGGLVLFPPLWFELNRG